MLDGDVARASRSGSDHGSDRDGLATAWTRVEVTVPKMSAPWSSAFAEDAPRRGSEGVNPLRCEIVEEEVLREVGRGDVVVYFSTQVVHDQLCDIF